MFNSGSHVGCLKKFICLFVVSNPSHISKTVAIYMNRKRHLPEQKKNMSLQIHLVTRLQHVYSSQWKWLLIVNRTKKIYSWSFEYPDISEYIKKMILFSFLLSPSLYPPPTQVIHKSKSHAAISWADGRWAFPFLSWVIFSFSFTCLFSSLHSFPLFHQPLVCFWLHPPPDGCIFFFACMYQLTLLSFMLHVFIFVSC